MSTTDTATMLLLQQKMAALVDAPSTALPLLAAHQPSDAPGFRVNSQPFGNYPAPGANPVTILSYTVPQGLVAFIAWMAIVAIGGGFVDGTGNVVWRVWVNGQPQDGFDTLTAQVGSFVYPNPVQFALNEGDTFSITVEVPAGQPAMPPGANTGALVQGWTYPAGKESGQ